MRFRMSVALFMWLCGLAAALHAEPVEIKQGSEIGAGYTFRRGEICTVVTAHHVVKSDAVIQVTDRTGGTTDRGKRTYDNTAYDLALVVLPADSGVACSETWPDTGWMATTKFTTKDTFDLVRHHPDGNREELLVMHYAGGSPDTLALTPVVEQGYSGSVVRFGGQLAGLVQEVHPGTGRTDALRFDVIERLVGHMLKSVQSSAPVHMSGVFQRERENATWSAYVSAWIREKAGRATVDASDRAARCQIRVNVIEWARSQVPNPEYDALQRRYDSCGVMGGIAGVIVLKASPERKAACQKQVRAEMAQAGRTRQGHALTMEVTMKSQSGRTETKLDTVNYVMPSGPKRSRAEEESMVLQGTVGPVMEKMFVSGVCD